MGEEKFLEGRHMHAIVFNQRREGTGYNNGYSRGHNHVGYCDKRTNMCQSNQRYDIGNRNEEVLHLKQEIPLV